VASGGAQEHFGVRADLVTYAKSLGNGFPIAAIAGKEEVMMTYKPGSAAHGGTYSGNVVGTSAALKTLEILEREPVLDTIQKRGSRLMDGIHEILTEADLPHHMTGVPAMFGFILGTDTAPKDFRDYTAGDSGLYEEIGLEICRNGVMPDADGREPWFLCYSLSEADVDQTLSIFNDAVKAAKKA
jgi:glutamate-1-semialdehyde 2,1-aminomutase